MRAKFDESIGLYRQPETTGDLLVSTTLSDDLLAEAYLRFKNEKTLETIYYEGVPSIVDFLLRATKPETICLGAFIDRREARTRRSREFAFAGVAWVYDRQIMGNAMTKAEVGFGFFRH